MRTEHKYILNLLKSLVNIKSVSGTEREIMLRLEKEIKSWGAKTKRYRTKDKRFNLLARYGKGKPVLCLNAHADTVPLSGRSVPGARIKGGKLYGLGACDTKASLAAMMAAFKNYVTSTEKTGGTLDLLISIDEERRSREVYSVIKQGYRCDYAVVGEPTDLGIISCHMGQIFLEVMAKGKSTHSSAPWEGINAINELIDVTDKIRGLVEDNKNFPGIGRQSMNLGVIQGGDIANRVPDACRALIDIRIIPGRSTTDVFAKIAKVCAQHKNISCKALKELEPMRPNRKTAFINIVKEQVRRATGKKAIPKSARFWTEAADFRNEIGAETVVLGPGKAKLAHSENEYIELKQVFQAAEIYYSIICHLLSKEG